MKISKTVRSLSESSSSESESSESWASNSSPTSPKQSFEVPQTSDKPSTDTIQQATNDQNGGQTLVKKKKPPSPETMSKLMGIEVKELPSFRISKKKENGDVGSSGQPQLKRFRSEKRAEDLEQKWLLNQESPDRAAVNSRYLNPYDIDDIDDTPPQLNDIKPQGTAEKFKMIGEQWGSMVTPFLDEPTEGSLASKWPEYNTFKAYSGADRTNGHTSPYRHKRNSHDRKSKQKKQDRNDNRNSSRNAAVQTNSDCKVVSVSTQTSNSILPLSLKSLAASEFYHSQAEEMKEIYSSTAEGIDRVLTQTRICVFETLEAVALMKEKTDPSSLSRKFTEVVQRCRHNLDIITREFSRENSSFLKDSFLVINMKLMSFLYHKLYLARRSEVAGAKNILDDFLMKKLPTEQQMSQRVTSAIQFYATYMEHLAKSLNYSERADSIIDNCRSDFFMDFNFKEVKSDCPIQSLVSLINSAIVEINNIIEDSGRNFS